MSFNIFGIDSWETFVYFPFHITLGNWNTYTSSYDHRMLSSHSQGGIKPRLYLAHIVHGDITR
jgi:hypothetical protein